MAATASASAALAQSAVDPDLEDSNVSSPLTEVDDKDDNDEEIDRMQIDGGDDGDNSSLSGDENPGDDDDDRSDSASVLSDAGSDANSDGNDTEAETERLYDTPRNQRQKDVVVDQYNHGQVFEHTPSKLRRAAKPEDKDDDAVNENDDRESVSGDEGSGASSASDADETPTKPINKKKMLYDKGPSADSQDRKRKRSPVADQSETEQPQKKRTGSVGAASIEDPSLNDDAKAAANADSAIQSDAEDENRDTGTEGEAQERSSRSSRSSRKSTRNGLRSKDGVKEEEEDTGADAATETAGEEATDHHEDEAEAEVEEEDEADIAAKNQEELERKQAAFKDWSHIEEMFGIFRDRLYKDRLQRLEEEEQSLLADVPTHREYLNMKQCLDDRLNQKLQEVNTEFDFQLKANERWAVAQRAQIWSQFFQAVREKREQTLESLNKQWYDVQTSRRNAHSLQDYGLLFPRDPTQRLRNAIAYNSEVSTLAGMAKYEGFPAGPEMRGASASELKSDLSAMERTRRGRQKSSAFQQRDDYQSPNINQIGPAGEQFLKDTPWANPNHSAHKMARQGATPHEESRAVPQGPIFQNENPGSSLKSPALSARLSESPEMSRSILKPSAHQMKRVGSVPSASRAAKATAV
ncbi:hypothetical protein NLG97_g5067 [Lecanicillium saksenae]|uniref:Uncharacterized protein n=1 Tax=Lecanicillium saksenae TaxID=468837 RepID=A0ACC1QTH2_9HYPO|nr:hypothetical protein NLG97_g5067 [Lecanicillium saksenae]